MTLTPADVVMLAKQKGAPLVACTYTEPVVFSEYVLDIAVAGRAVGVRTVMISNGYVQEQPLADLCREIAAYKVDLKGFDAAFFKRHTGGELKHVLDTLRRLRKHGTWTEIVSLVIPTQNDSEAEIRALARFVRDEVGPETPVHFTRFHPSYRLQNLPSTPGRDARALPRRGHGRGPPLRLPRQRARPPRGEHVLPGLRQAAHPPLRHGGGREPPEGRRLPRLPPADPRHLDLKSTIIFGAAASAGARKAIASREVRTLRSPRRDRRGADGPGVLRPGTPPSPGRSRSRRSSPST